MYTNTIHPNLSQQNSKPAATSHSLNIPHRRPSNLSLYPHIPHASPSIHIHISHTKIYNPSPTNLCTSVLTLPLTACTFL